MDVLTLKLNNRNVPGHKSFINLAHEFNISPDAVESMKDFMDITPHLKAKRCYVSDLLQALFAIERFDALIILAEWAVDQNHFQDKPLPKSPIQETREI